MAEEMYAARVEEIDSEEGEEIRVDAHGRRIFSDQLRFTGGDLAPMGRERKAYPYQDDYSDSESDSDDEDGEGVSEQQVALRDKEEALVQSALARIRRAQEKGKVEVKLRQDELVALENRRKRLQAEAAAKAKSAQSSRKGSASEAKKSKRSSPPMATVPIMHPDIQYAAASSSERPSSRRRSNQKALNEAALGPAPGAGPRAPGVVVEDAQGRVTYAPISYQGSPSRPRSSSSMSAQNYSGRLGMQSGYPYAGGGGGGGYLGGRHVSDNTRPPARPLPHEEEWVDSRRGGEVGMREREREREMEREFHDPFLYQVGRGDGTPPQQQQQQTLGISEEEAARRYYASLPMGSYSQPSGIQYAGVQRVAYGYAGGSRNGSGSGDPRSYLVSSSSDPTMLRQRGGTGGMGEEGSEDELSREREGGSQSVRASPKVQEGKGGVPKRKPVSGKKKGKR